jgi:hypothetical protein
MAAGCHQKFFCFCHWEQSREFFLGGGVGVRGYTLDIGITGGKERSWKRKVLFLVITLIFSGLSDEKWNVRASACALIVCLLTRWVFESPPVFFFSFYFIHSFFRVSRLKDFNAIESDVVVRSCTSCNFASRTDWSGRTAPHGWYSVIISPYIIVREEKRTWSIGRQQMRKVASYIYIL